MLRIRKNLVLTLAVVFFLETLSGFVMADYITLEIKQSYQAKYEKSWYAATPQEKAEFLKHYKKDKARKAKALRREQRMEARDERMWRRDHYRKKKDLIRKRKARAKAIRAEKKAKKRKRKEMAKKMKEMERKLEMSHRDR